MSGIGTGSYVLAWRVGRDYSDCIISVMTDHKIVETNSLNIGKYRKNEGH